MPGLADLFGLLGGDSQLTRIVLWQMVGQLVGTTLGPYERALEYGVNERTPNAALSPADLASAVIRTFLGEADAATEAAKFGINAERFHTLVDLAGLALAPEELAVALRRGLIPEDGGSAESVGFRQGIAQGNLHPKWGDVVKGLAINLPTPNDALEALLEGQIDEARARELYAKFGGAPEFFTMLFDTRGSAPSPVQAWEMANRRIIPWKGTGPDAVTFEQAFLEGPWRNKWLEPFMHLAEYLPPPRTVTAMVRDGSLTDDQALELFEKTGLTPALAASYLKSAHHTKTTAAHELARGTIEKLYEDSVISRDDAIKALVTEGWSAHDAEYLLAVVDLSLQQKTLNAVISRIKALYVSHKLTAVAATEALTTLDVIGDRQAAVLELWNIERAANVRELTPAQIEGAHFYKVIGQDEATALLVQLGYTPHDAWIALSVRSHAPLPDEPSRTAVGLAPGVQT